jgi:putative chitinase
MPMPQITAAQIRQMSRTAADRIVDGIVTNQHFIEQGGIDTPLRLCHFMAQLAVESANFRVTLEFASGRAYEGREDLGNTEPGDGPRYRGRGLIQTTGRANYRQGTQDLRQLLGAGVTVPDFEANPVELENFPWALLAGITYWRGRNINRAADRDDVVTVTKLINGGLNGLDVRRQYLAKAKPIWLTGNQSAGASGGQAQAAHPVLRSGDNGQDVVDLQNALIDAGYRLSADGVFGQHTDDAVRDFQDAHDLDADGIVGPRTWAMLLNRSDAG